MAIEGNASEQSAVAPEANDASDRSAATGEGKAPLSRRHARQERRHARRERRHARQEQIRRLVQAIRDSDLNAADEVILRLSRSRRWLAPLALTVGAFAMLLVGVKLLFTNWRLTLIQVLPAMWIWGAMYDLKAKVLRGKSVVELHGSTLVITLVLGITVITAASFYLNAVFAFAISEPGQPAIRPAFTKVRSHLLIVLGSGTIVGILLGISAILVPRWGSLFWFAVSLGIVIGIMMICYVAVPSRLIGIKPVQSRRDKLAASAVGGAIGAVICTPPYALGRLGLILLGSSTFFVLGVILFALGLTLQAGATGAVKTVKMSAKLVSGPRPEKSSQTEPEGVAE